MKIKNFAKSLLSLEVRISQIRKLSILDLNYFFLVQPNWQLDRHIKMHRVLEYFLELEHKLEVWPEIQELDSLW